MILNANTGTHDMYLRGRRRHQAQPQKPIQRELVLVDGVRPDRNGTLAEQCAWMKLRQQQQRRRS